MSPPPSYVAVTPPQPAYLPPGAPPSTRPAAGVTALAQWWGLLPPFPRLQRLLPFYPLRIGTLPMATSKSMANLMASQFCKLQATTASSGPRGSTPVEARERGVVTPLKLDAWRSALAQHPDRKWVEQLLQGIQYGFRIGLKPSAACKSAPGNLPSAQGQQQLITEYLQHQVRDGLMLGPYAPHECQGVVVSPIGVVPKRTPGAFRVIVDLSSPKGHSVNDNLCRHLTHVAYSSVEDAALAMYSLGLNTELAKIDVRSAYRIIPIHPSERVFLGIQWQGDVFIDCQLPFGLASAPAIFSALAEALEWVLVHRGVRGVIHYLDDFLLLGAPGSGECTRALALTRATCKELGVPLADDKIEGPTSSLTFLGIRLSSQPLSVSLPQDKLALLRSKLGELLGAKCVRDRASLESLIGHLVHATKACPLGKAFLSGLFHTLHSLRPGQPRRLNVATRADIAWWHLLCTTWSGISVHQFLLLGDPNRHLFTDASGSWGCGAWAMPNWLQSPWPSHHCLSSIALKELVPVVLAAATWGGLWGGLLIMLHSDNVAVVSQVNSLHARDPAACNMLRCLAFFQAHFDFRLRAVHIAGARNTDADDLSRNRTTTFLNRHPHASPSPSQVNQELLLLLCQQPADWTSVHWRGRFADFWRQALPNPPGRSTRLAGTAISHLPSPSLSLPPR